MRCCGGPGVNVKATKAAKGKKQPRKPLAGGGAQPGAIVGNVGTGNSLTAQTKNMMMKVHEQILAGVLKLDTKVVRKGVKGGQVGLTALVTGVSTSTVDNVVKEYRAMMVAMSDGSAPMDFAEPLPHGAVPMTTEEKVRKVTEINPDIIPSIRRLIDIEHKGFRAVTCRKLVRLLKEQSEEAGGQICTTISAVRRILKVMGYVFGAAGRVHYQKETPGNVAYRYQYLLRKMANRRTGKNKHGVVSPRGVHKIEVYLDESYCNVNHGFRHTWYEAGKSIVGRTGVGPRANIIGAIAVGDLEDGTCVCEVVPGTLAIWHGNNRSRGTYVAHGPKMAEALKAHVMQEVLEPEDYHGNVTGPLFEDWLRDLCDRLNQQYGTPCIIYLDGARSHKRIKEGSEQPTKGWSKTKLTEWLLIQSPDCGVVNARENKKDPDNGGWSQDRMWQLAKVLKVDVPKMYRIIDIAKDNGGHQIQWTPPYHPELQPIERVWACVKNEIARMPVLGIAELLKRLKKNFRLPEDDGCLSLKVMHMTVRKTRLQEDLYTAAHLQATRIATEAAEEAQDVETLDPEDPDDESVCAHTQGDDLQDDCTGQDEESEDDDE